MPRKARIDAPGALHHIILRGIERRKIFYDDSDRDNLLNRLGLILTDTKSNMPNPDKPEKQITNHKQITMTEIQNSKQALVVGVWDLIDIWYLNINFLPYN